MCFLPKTIYQGVNPMRNNLHIYHKVLGQLCQWLPDERLSRKRNLALLVTGIYLSAAVHLALVVREWPVEAKSPSLVTRLQRFLDNERLSPRRCYQPLAAELIAAFATTGLRLVIDVTKVGFNHRAMVVGLAYRRRTLPLTWSVHRGSKGVVDVNRIIDLLTEVYALVPYDCPVEIVADCGFRSADLLRWLRQREWHFVMRHPGNSKIRLPSGQWVYLRDLPIQPGETHVIGWVWISRTNPAGPVWLALHWGKGEEEPWFLVSDLAPQNARPLINAYKRRMWMEEMFGDMKRHGFNLESTQLRRARRIERLMLAVSIAFVWLITLGSWVVKNGYRHLIDVNSRRDKSYFRLGWDWIAHCLRLGYPVRLHFRPYL
jgi:hypothetical protein